MQQVKPDLTFITTLYDLVENPENTMKSFQPIEKSHKAEYSLNQISAAAALVFSILSFASFKRRIPIAAAVCSVASLVGYFKSVKIKQVPTKEYNEQVKAINTLFDPCIQGLKDAFTRKANAIRNAVNNQKLASINKVKDAVEKVAGIYDRTINANEWVSSNVDENPINNGSYATLISSAKKISEWDETTLHMNEKLRTKFGELKKAANIFLNGNKESAVTDFFYVQYGCMGGSAVVL